MINNQIYQVLTKLNEKNSLNKTDIKNLLYIIKLDYENNLEEENSKYIKNILSNLDLKIETDVTKEDAFNKYTEIRYSQENHADGIVCSDLKIFLVDRTRRMLSNALSKDIN